MCEPQRKRSHHFVPQRYLSAWTDGGRLYCKQGDRVFSTGTPGVAAENMLYQLRYMSREDVLFLREKIIENIKIPTLKRHALGWLELFMEAQSILQSAGSIDDLPQSLRENLIALEEGFEEEIHTKNEHDAYYSLDSLRKGDFSFFEDLEKVLSFCLFLGFQYFRTRLRVVQFAETLENFSNLNVSAVWSVLRIIFGWSLGANMLIMFENKSWKLELLHAASGSEFITSDQPIINLASENQDGALSKLHIFFPVSPDTAVMIDCNSDEPGIFEREITSDEVDKLNRILFTQSYQQVYACSEDVLSKL